MQRRKICGVFKSPTSMLGVSLDEKYIVSKEAVVFEGEIGEGASARVFEGVFEGRKVALKKIKLSKNVPKYQEMLKREAKTILDLKHDNVVKLFGICVSEMTLVFENCSKTYVLNEVEYTSNTLRQLIDTLGPAFSMDLKLEALYQVANAMDYIHSKNVVHCDIKSHNILVTGDKEDRWIFKVADIGEAHLKITTTYTSTVSHTKKEAVCTIPYQAPELLKGNPKYNKPADVYAFGMVMFELLNVEEPYPWYKECGSNITQIQSMVLRGERPVCYRPVVYINKPYVKLMEECWQQEANNRPEFGTIEKAVLEIDAEEGRCETSQTTVMTSAESPRKLKKGGDTQKGIHRQLFPLKSEINVTSAASVDKYPFISPDEVRGILQRTEEALAKDNLIMPSDTIHVSSYDDTMARSSQNIDANDEDYTVNEADLMRWSGYAKKYFGITELYQYQVKAMNALEKGRDVLIVQSTSSGKSLCYQLPASMVKEERGLILVIVPIVALAQDQAKYLIAHGIKTTILGSLSKRNDYEDLFQRNIIPKVLIVTPETLMGGIGFKGIWEKLLEAHKSDFILLKLIMLLMRHTIYGTGGSFRQSYNRINELNTLFPEMAMIALTTILTTEAKRKMKADILR